MAPPFKEVEFDIMYGEGISKEGDLVDLAANDGVVEKAGAWYAYNNAKLGQGRENTKNFLRENPEIVKEIMQKVLAKHGMSESPTAINLTTGEIQEDATAEDKKSAKIVRFPVRDDIKSNINEQLIVEFYSR